MLYGIELGPCLCVGHFQNQTKRKNCFLREILALPVDTLSKWDACRLLSLAGLAVRRWLLLQPAAQGADLLSICWAVQSGTHYCRVFIEGLGKIQGDLLEAPAVIPFSYSFILKSSQSSSLLSTYLHKLLLLDCCLLICHQAGHERSL